MGKLAIYGTGGFAREILPIAQMHLPYGGNSEFTDLVFVDDHPGKNSIFGISVVSFGDLAAGDVYILAVGDGTLRQTLDERCLAAGLIPESIFADSFRQGHGVSIGDGGVFCGQTIITTSATIGRQFQCNIYSYVAHDCVIGDYVTFAPNVSCNGNVHIEDLAYIGTGAVLKQGTPDKPLIIGRGAIVGMGAVVTKDVAAGAVVVGNPAKPR